MKKLLLAGAMLWLGVASALAAGTGALKQFGREIADTVERAMPSVVVVRTEAVQYHLGRDPFWGRWYKIPERLAGQGSGVIIRKEGYVLTSNHVVEEAQHIQVALPDGTQFPAKIVGRDETTDLAVLKIEKAGTRVFSAIEPGDSDKVRVGEFAIAIGSPFTLNSSVTLGIVSQKGRAVGMLPYEDFIQTDASINPGNSGGPLVDVDGKLIGINAVIQTAGPDSQGNIGIGFAVPANLAMRVAGQLIDRGHVERPWLGIQMRDLAEDETANHTTHTWRGVAGRATAEPVVATPKTGVLVAEVIENGPAEKIGMRMGDVITGVDGQPVSAAHDVQKIVWMRGVGEALRVEILRGGQKKVLMVVTERMPAE
ncbi:MAG: PDZ domain-containing protein [Verrucomicrobia bacterium]|nr:MAG: PDZ domain-containing protein [Verrucomicrobiota bacterium]